MLSPCKRKKKTYTTWIENLRYDRCKLLDGLKGERIPCCIELCEANAMASSGVHEDLTMPMFFF